MRFEDEEREAGAEQSGLPARCHVVLPELPAGENVGLCVRGESGVRKTSINVGEELHARGVVRAINESLGIDAAAEFAMLAGCMLGWDNELADPRFVRATDPRFGGAPPGVSIH